MLTLRVSHVSGSQIIIHIPENLVCCMCDWGGGGGLLLEGGRVSEFLPAGRMGVG